ncbi:hypothetical protein HDA40_002465 [Hamadaea flava]|uniref:Uncharacterized protein n=1 Tax=Hamadaea flava TaxID=1742688 RepID=A0ABV8LKJ7_9ACTN|nr:hypothetical protein [Hamadaea flava]MCP2323958.1 hypothetical protein [Hamadaea flava]
MKTTDDLRAALSYQSPSSTPDTIGMIAKGRRIRAARRAVAGVAAVTVAAGVGLFTALQPGSGPDQPVPPIAGGPPNPVLVAAISSTATEAPVQFDPLRRTLNVGWIPAGLGGQHADITPWQQTFGGHDAAYVNGGPDIGLVVTVLAKNRPLTDFSGGALGLPSSAVAKPTEPVNGGAAECLTDPQVPGSCSAIRWQYAPDAWARVSYAGSAGATPAQAAAVARRVAESVTLTKDQAVRMPFTLTGKLAGMTVTRTSTNIYSTPGFHGEAWSADVQLAPAGTVVKPDDDLYQIGLIVDVMFVPGDPSGRIKDRDGEPNTTVNGHPAWRAADGTAVIVFGASDTRSVVEYPGHHGDATTAYADVVLLAHPADPADWLPLK